MPGNPFLSYEGPTLRDMLGVAEMQRQDEQRAFTNKLALDTHQREMEEHKLKMDESKLAIANTKAAVEQHAQEIAQQFGAAAGTRLLEQHFGPGHRLVDTGDGLLKRLEPGEDPMTGGTYIDTRRKGLLADRAIEAMASSYGGLKNSYAPGAQAQAQVGPVAGGPQPGPPPMARTAPGAPPPNLDAHSLAAVSALQAAGAPASAIGRVVDEQRARDAQQLDDVTRPPDTSLFEPVGPMSPDLAEIYRVTKGAVTPMTAPALEGGPNRGMSPEIARMVLEAQSSPTTRLTPEQEARVNAVAAGIFKPEEMLAGAENLMGHAHANASLQEIIRQHDAEMRYKWAALGMHKGRGGVSSKAELRDEKEAWNEIMKIRAERAGKHIETQYSADQNGQLVASHKAVDTGRPMSEEDKKVGIARENQLLGRLEKIAKRRGESFDPGSVPDFPIPEAPPAPPRADEATFQKNALDILHSDDPAGLIAKIKAVGRANPADIEDIEKLYKRALKEPKVARDLAEGILPEREPIDRAPRWLQRAHKTAPVSPAPNDRTDMPGTTQPVGSRRGAL